MGAKPTFRFYTMMERIKKEFQAIIGNEFVLLEVKEDSHAQMVKLIIDSENGVSLNDTTRISRRINESEVIPKYYSDQYGLEVSSPGITAPLVLPFQYQKNIGRKLFVKFSREGQTKTLEGVLQAVDEDGITINGKKRVTISFPDIEVAKVIISLK
ncbi:MAG: ribosome maturation factor RimP [Fidelibacterota bacterium]